MKTGNVGVAYHRLVQSRNRRTKLHYRIRRTSSLIHQIHPLRSQRQYTYSLIVSPFFSLYESSHCPTEVPPTPSLDCELLSVSKGTAHLDRKRRQSSRSWSEMKGVAWGLEGGGSTIDALILGLVIDIMKV